MRHGRTINNNILFCSLHSQFMHHVLAVHNIIHNRFFVVTHIGITIAIIPSYAPCRPCSYRSRYYIIFYNNTDNCSSNWLLYTYYTYSYNIIYIVLATRADVLRTTIPRFNRTPQEVDDKFLPPSITVIIYSNIISYVGAYNVYFYNTVGVYHYIIRIRIQ